MLGTLLKKDLLFEISQWRPRYLCFLSEEFHHVAGSFFRAGERTPSAPTHDSRNLRADRCAPVSSSIPDRNAQNIRLTEMANGPYTSAKFSRGRAKI